MSLESSRTRKRASRAGLLGGRVQGKLVQGKGGQIARGRWCKSPQAKAESWEGASLCLFAVNLLPPFHTSPSAFPRLP